LASVGWCFSLFSFIFFPSFFLPQWGPPFSSLYLGRLIVSRVPFFFSAPPDGRGAIIWTGFPLYTVGSVPSFRPALFSLELTFLTGHWCFFLDPGLQPVFFFRAFFSPAEHVLCTVRIPLLFLEVSKLRGELSLLV